MQRSFFYNNIIIVFVVTNSFPPPLLSALTTCETSDGDIKIKYGSMMIIIFHQLDTVWCDFNKLSPPLILFYYWSQLHKPWSTIKPLKEHLKRHFKLNPRVKRLEFLATYATDGKSSLRCSESILTQHCLKYTHMSSAEERKTDTDCRSLRKKNYIMAAFKEKVFFANFKFFLFFFFFFQFFASQKKIQKVFFLTLFFCYTSLL